MMNEHRIEQAKKLMEWEENREPTMLEYLRNYRDGTIGEIHIEAVITSATQEAIIGELENIPGHRTTDTDYVVEQKYLRDRIAFWKADTQGTDLPSEDSTPASGDLEAPSGAGEKGRL